MDAPGLLLAGTPVRERLRKQLEPAEPLGETQLRILGERRLSPRFLDPLQRQLRLAGDESTVDQEEMRR
jgi:hypothetical protein